MKPAKTTPQPEADPKPLTPEMIVALYRAGMNGDMEAVRLYLHIDYEEDKQD